MGILHDGANAAPRSRHGSLGGRVQMAMRLLQSRLFRVSLIRKIGGSAAAVTGIYFVPTMTLHMWWIRTRRAKHSRVLDPLPSRSVESFEEPRLNLAKTEPSTRQAGRAEPREPWDGTYGHPVVIR